MLDNGEDKIKFSMKYEKNKRKQKKLREEDLSVETNIMHFSRVMSAKKCFYALLAASHATTSDWIKGRKVD